MAFLHRNKLKIVFSFTHKKKLRAKLGLPGLYFKRRVRGREQISLDEKINSFFDSF